MKTKGTRISANNRKRITDGLLELLDKQELSRHEIRSKMIKYGETYTINNMISILITEGVIVEENGLIKKAER